MKNQIKYISAIVLALTMIAFNVSPIFIEPPVSEGQRIFEDFRHEAIEGGGEITISKEKVEILSQYILERQTNGEFRVRFGMFLLGLILLIYSTIQLIMEYNKRLKHDAQKARAS